MAWDHSAYLSDGTHLTQKEYSQLVMTGKVSIEKDGTIRILEIHNVMSPGETMWVTDVENSFKEIKA